MSPLNWNLLMLGCPLFKSTNKFIRVVVAGYGCFLVNAYIFIALRYMYSGKVPGNSSMLFLVVFRIWEALYRALAASTIIIIWSIRKRFLRILSKICTLLSNEDRKKLYFLSMVLFICKTLFIFGYRAKYLWSLYGNLCGSWREGWGPFLSSIVDLSVKCQDWELIISCVFITLLKAIHLAETNVMNILGHNLEKIGPKVLYRQLYEILSLKEYFMKCVSFLLLFLYSYVFIESVGGIVKIHLLMDSPLESNDKKLTAIILNIRNVVIVIQNVLLTLYTHHLSCQSKSQLRKMEYHINMNQDRLKKRFIMQLIQEAKMYEYRAGDFFAINKELLLSLFSAFVTFTVLFVQLINQIK